MLLAMGNRIAFITGGSWEVGYMWGSCLLLGGEQASSLRSRPHTHPFLEALVTELILEGLEEKLGWGDW